MRGLIGINYGRISSPMDMRDDKINTGQSLRERTGGLLRGQGMPAKSKAQKSAAGMALSAKRGKVAVSELKGSALQMYKSMTVKQLEEFAGGSSKGLPKRKK